MRNAQLSELLDGLKAEVGISLSVAANTQQLEHLKALINRVYERYYHDFQWPFLRTKTDMDVPANTRYIPLPTQPSFLDTTEAWVREADLPSSIWYEMIEGIDECDYNTVQEGLSQWYPRKWMLYSEDGATPTQIELWPPPDVDVVIRFRGKRAFAKLVNSADRCLIDDRIVILFAAADYLARQQAADAGLKMDMAVRTYAMLRAQASKSGKFKYKRDTDGYRPRPWRDYIP